MERIIYAKGLFLVDEPINFYFYNSPTVTPHRHADFYEIFIITKGAVSHTFNGKKTIMNKRDFCIVRPGDTHGFTVCEGESSAQHLNIRITSSEILKQCNEIDNTFFEYISNLDMPSKHLSKQEHSQIDFWVNKLISSYDNSKKNFFLSTIVRLFLSLFYTNVNIMNNSYPEWLNTLLLKLNNIEFIDKSAKDVYELAHYSSNFTIKAFKEYLGVTPTVYLNKLKLNYACNLLTNTDYSILYISNAIGFSSLSYFISFFKNTYGITPSQFRKKLI